MKNSKLNNSIVLKGMASNIVDEAIVILKPNVKIRNMEHAKNHKIKEKSFSKNLILREAENVISEYVNKIDERVSNIKFRKMENKIKMLKITNIMFFIILIASLLV